MALSDKVGQETVRTRHIQIMPFGLPGHNEIITSVGKIIIINVLLGHNTRYKRPFMPQRIGDGEKNEVQRLHPYSGQRNRFPPVDASYSEVH